MANVLAPRKPDMEFEQEFQKGEIAGIRLFIQLPETAVEDLQRQVKEIEDAAQSDPGRDS